MQWERFRESLSCLTLGAAIVAAGCGSRARAYTPSPKAARTSLDAALAAWRDGHPPGAIVGAPTVHVVDTVRQPGQVLRGFEVLSETSVGGEGRCYVVGLSLDNPAARQRARYIVVGIDPIWVFRKEDYDKLTHWEHPLEKADPDASENQSPADQQSTATSSSAASNERS